MIRGMIFLKIFRKVLAIIIFLFYRLSPGFTGAFFVSLCETEVVLSLFGAAKSNQKLLVARKASAFISKSSLQKQNFLRSYFVVVVPPQTVVFVTLPYSIKARFTFLMRRLSVHVF